MRAVDILFFELRKKSSTCRNTLFGLGLGEKTISIIMLYHFNQRQYIAYSLCKHIEELKHSIDLSQICEMLIHNLHLGAVEPILATLYFKNYSFKYEI